MTQSKREQAIVGLFVIVAGALLVGTVVALGGISRHQGKTYHAYFTFAGGVDAGTPVRYSGGPKVGRVEKLGIDPQNPTRIVVTFNVEENLPVKMDSRVKIMSMTPLGDNHVEVMPGSADSPIAPAGTILPSDAYVDLNTLMAEVQDITPQAKQLINSLNDRVTELKGTLARVDDILSPQNRSNLSAVLSDTRGLIQENRPHLKSTIERLDQVSGRLQPVLDDLRKTSAQANQAIDHIDALISENRPDFHSAILDLRQSLATVTNLTGRLNQTFDANSVNIDQLLENLRDVTENLKEFTDMIKARPNLLIRSNPGPEHKPGGKQ